jgi:hypothetical protein
MGLAHRIGVVDGRRSHDDIHAGDPDGGNTCHPRPTSATAHVRIIAADPFA